MADHKSELKRARQNEIHRMRNKAVKSRVKSIIKEVQLAVGEAAIETAREKLNIAKSVIDKAAKKKVLHKKTAARKISRLSRSVNTVA
ncbi:MAG: 30S ribosomal protein S20 [Desulfobacteraceae bacterium IS3]|nr:MAG: 30S ribosomal protein S20 [Desulfobacteraceae bacterium IS3]